MRHHTRPVRARHLPQRAVTRPPSYRSGLHGRLGTEAARPAQDGPQRLVVEVRQDLPRPRIEVRGELDLDSAGLLTAMLDHARRGRATGGADVEVDLAGVTFADSHGIAPVLHARTRIVAASAPVRRLLRLLDESGPSRPDAWSRPA